MSNTQFPHPLLHLPIVPFIRQSDFAVRKPWRVPARRLLDYLLIYIQEGECLIQVEQTPYHFHAGEFCLIQPNDLLILEGTTNTITPFAHMDIFYHPQREQSFPTRPGQVDITPFQHLLQPRLNDFSGISIPVKFVPTQAATFRETMLKMVGLWQQHDIVSQLEAQHLATALVLSLLKDQSQLTVESHQEPHSLNWITSYLSFHLAEPVSVADMAKRAHLSPSHFSSLFHKQFGMSPHQYLLHLRIHHAQDLLKTSSLTQAQIAEYCGFADVQHFTKAFKKVIGSTPKRLRQLDQ